MDKLMEVQAGITRLGTWIDANSSGVDPLAWLWHRVSKVAEEHGETIEALIGATAMNPRKGESHSWEDVDKELLDTIVAAWGALEHRHGNHGVVADMLPPFVAGLLQRVGLSPIGGPTVEEGDRVRVLEWDNRESGFREHATPVPVLGRVTYVGSEKFAGQPTIDTEGEENYGGFAARWELLTGTA